jgi:endonuclease-8
MPEGHTVHRIARDHNCWFANQKMVVMSPQGRFSEGAEILNGRKLKAVEAHGKHLFYRWSGNHTMHLHLGLYGKFRLHNHPLPSPRGAVRLRVIGNERGFDLNGPNQCELLSKQDCQRLLDRLGPDPLREDADPELAWDRIHRSRAAIGTLLMNQAVIAGIGNIYRCEILFLLGIHPERPGREISPEEFAELWRLTTELMQIGVRYNRIVTVPRSSVEKPLSRLTARERLLIYKRSGCPVCGHPIRSWELANRRVFACETCQPR